MRTKSHTDIRQQQMDAAQTDGQNDVLLNKIGWWGESKKHSQN